MSQSNFDRMQSVLQAIAHEAPHPWYPSQYAEHHQIDRNSLDPILNQLRLLGWIEIAGWERGKGQAYALTQVGRATLESGRPLADAVRTETRPVTAPLTTRRGYGGDRWTQGETVRDAILRPRPTPVTQVLFGAILLVYLLGMWLAFGAGQNPWEYLSRPDPMALIRSGALIGEEVSEGKYWQLLTCCFVHGNILHLFMNGLSLILIGPRCEQLWGSGRFLAIYLAAGIGGSALAVLVEPSAMLVGASGAIWGLMTSLIVWVTLNRAHLPPPLIRTWLQQLVTILVLNLILSFSPGISMEAHLGGGAIGFLTASLLHVLRFRSSRLSRGLAMLGLLLIPTLIFVGLRSQPQDELGRQLQDSIERIRTLDREFDAIERPDADGELRAQWMKRVDAEFEANASFAQQVVSQIPENRQIKRRTLQLYVGLRLIQLMRLQLEGKANPLIQSEFRDIRKQFRSF
ncbi:rhomboid family intramembrane serine protease [Tuwongella immobilis]|uniref:Peptidase S54 rhomboid domain-containing protein n=1 Tax=Tuwongella immobilis TaxID=692036 RepID=A0A6C2YPI1_9BACT|nr:rhomboid family intramembrane serine protease [Tuwongella immobilis]VIP03257.1 rhomboid family protein : Uncharacterized protein OS=Bacillus sp. SG-1 GN=BSG1_06322 PE=4 SV=1: Rhomboid [Tuwongella immobilis]VTS03859.1 rhomboid family protein : Uncharacterized protein OS=Bacillus sp. SG-1 GN=BSG1_06322 PE=4 SV=1: Rhomboid [Tuwongella immobilis]